MKNLVLGSIPTGHWKGKTDDPRNPYILIQHAIILYNDYFMKKSDRLKTLFLRAVDSFANRLVIRNDFGVWPYSCLFWRAKLYGCKIPWVSALAQGQGISALLRAYSLVKDKKYLAKADYALKAFSVPMADGGVLSIDSDDNHWWYEEYACPYAKPSGVLNGFIFSLLGIHDFHLVTGDDVSKQLFEEGISTLRYHLKDFDTDRPYKLTYYDKQKHIVTFPYHLLHIRLMKTLYNITKEEIFERYQKRWERCKEEWLTRRINRWLWKFMYVRSGYSLEDSVELLLKLAYNARAASILTL